MAVLRPMPTGLNQRGAAWSIDSPARRQSRPTVPVTGPPTGCRRSAVHAGLDPYPPVGDPGEDLLGGGAGRGVEQPLIGFRVGGARQSPDKLLGFFRDCRGREMAAGVQAAGISDDRKTERAYLNMEARCLATEKCDLQKGCCFIRDRWNLGRFCPQER